MTDHHDLAHTKPFTKDLTPLDIYTIPNLGIYHDVSKELPLVVYATQSLPELAEFADYITRGSFREEWYRKRLLSLTTDMIKERLAVIDICAVGGFAWCRIHADAELSNHAAKLLARWRVVVLEEC